MPFMTFNDLAAINARGRDSLKTPTTSSPSVPNSSAANPAPDDVALDAILPVDDRVASVGSRADVVVNQSRAMAGSLEGPVLSSRLRNSTNLLQDAQYETASAHLLNEPLVFSGALNDYQAGSVDPLIEEFCEESTSTHSFGASYDASVDSLALATSRPSKSRASGIAQTQLQPPSALAEQSRPLSHPKNNYDHLPATSKTPTPGRHPVVAVDLSLAPPPSRQLSHANPPSTNSSLAPSGALIHPSLASTSSLPASKPYTAGASHAIAEPAHHRNFVHPTTIVVTRPSAAVTIPAPTIAKRKRAGAHVGHIDSSKRARQTRVEEATSNAGSTDVPLATEVIEGLEEINGSMKTTRPALVKDVIRKGTLNTGGDNMIVQKETADISLEQQAFDATERKKKEEIQREQAKNSATPKKAQNVLAAASHSGLPPTGAITSAALTSGPSSALSRMLSAPPVQPVRHDRPAIVDSLESQGIHTVHGQDIVHPIAAPAEQADVAWDAKNSNWWDTDPSLDFLLGND